MNLTKPQRKSSHPPYLVDLLCLTRDYGGITSLLGSLASHDHISIWIAYRKLSSSLHYSFRPGPCFVSSKTPRLHVPHPQDFPSLVLEFAPRNSPLRLNFLYLQS